MHAKGCEKFNEVHSTVEVARRAGIHKDTLLRWLRAGLVREPTRDRHGWRFFTDEEAAAVVRFAQISEATTHPLVGGTAEDRASYLGRLNGIDWDFAGAKTDYLTHGIHPYPAKFIPQIPNALIQELSTVGDTVCDIFCGSGTTLVEVLSLKRHAIGLDANPLACLLTRAKTSPISSEDACALSNLSVRAKNAGDTLLAGGNDSLFPADRFVSKEWRPDVDAISFWFDDFVIEELAECLAWAKRLPSAASRELALAAFSAIVVAVSRQDSDTRYVRREKNLRPGETFRRFGRSLAAATKAAIDFSELIESRFSCSVIECDVLSRPDLPPIDLVVCSPPYPNAYSYHLYHMTRMLWLQMDQPRFKREEIGSHRKYSSKSSNGATIDTFRREFKDLLTWLSGPLKKSAYACFVVGDSTIKGERISNANLISEVGKDCGFVEVARIDRTMQATKKAFNPAIGKIKTEQILILRNQGMSP